ncbi:tetratricopeptide repeat-like superfamily protein, partial [Tanacetum coccineum]
IDEALETSQMAGSMDSINAAKYFEACVAYGEGLYNGSFNSMLLCNRAACGTKLGQFEKAIDDCDMALNICPSYNKAIPRRADCYAKVNYPFKEPIFCPSPISSDLHSTCVITLDI